MKIVQIAGRRSVVTRDSRGGVFIMSRLGSLSSRMDDDVRRRVVTDDAAWRREMERLEQELIARARREWKRTRNP